MKARAIAVLAALPACYAGLEGRGDATPSDETAADPPTRATDGSAEESSDVDTSSTGSDDALAADAYDCVGTLVHEQPGEVLAVAAEASALELQPLPPGAGFVCMRIELALDTATLQAEDDTCPVYVALASIRGTAPGGEDLAAAFVHAFDGDASTCERGDDRLAIGNFRELTDDVPIAPLDGRIGVRVLVQPFVSRVELVQDGFVVAHASADLFPASVADTRDPLVRLGLPRVAGGTVTPWYGASYHDLRIWAEIVPP